MTGPIAVGSKYGADQPPWRKPPLVSSSGPPGACTTPSRLMNSLATMRIVTPSLHAGYLGTYDDRAAPDSSVASHGSAAHGRPRCHSSPVDHGGDVEPGTPGEDSGA